MEIQGKFLNVKPIQEVTATFKKREFVVQTVEQYPQEILLELHNTYVDLIDSYTEGDLIKVKYNLRGKNFVNDAGETKWFNTLQAWSIEKI